MIRRLVIAARAAGAAIIVIAAASPAGAQSSWGIGVQTNGAIFFCDRGRDTVWRLDPDGHRTAAGPGISCRAVVTGRDGAIYGESIPGDLTAARGVGIWYIDANGARQWLMPPNAGPEPGRWIVRDASGIEYSWNGTAAGHADSQILQRDAAGVTLIVAGAAWGQRDGPGRDAAFGNVAGLALAPDGSLVVADSGNIRRVSLLRNVRTEAVGVVTDSHLGLINMPGLWGRELGVATDATGAAVVVDPEAGRIVHVDRHGRATALWEPAGFPQRISGGRWGWRPTGVALVGRSYYVLDEWMGPVVLADLIGSPRLSLVDDAGRVTRIVTIADWNVRLAAGALLIVLASATWAQLRRRRAA